MTVRIRQLGHSFAGQVMGVDCRKPLSSGDVAAIHAGMNDCAVLVFRDQKLSDEEQLRFTLHFGTLEETHGGTPGPIHFRTKHEVRKLGPAREAGQLELFVPGDGAGPSRGDAGARL